MAKLKHHHHLLYKKHGPWEKPLAYAGWIVAIGLLIYLWRGV
jgi:hypothetical protein